ncbi:protein of unknown function [Streptomyces murinus]
MSPRVEDVPWPGVLDSVPEALWHHCTEPAFTDDGTPRVTACPWREAQGDFWRAGDIGFPEHVADPDGAGWLFRLLTDPRPEAYGSSPRTTTRPASTSVPYVMSTLCVPSAGRGSTP